MRKGISLMALVLTIVILIIMVSVAVLNSEGPVEEAIYAKFVNDVTVVQESVSMNLLRNEARYARNNKAQLLRWVGIIDGYTNEMANEGIAPNFNASTITIKGNKVLKISSSMAEEVNLEEEDINNYYLDAKGKVYHVGLQIGENMYYTAEDDFIPSDPLTSGNNNPGGNNNNPGGNSNNNPGENNNPVISADVQEYIDQGYIPIYSAEQLSKVGSNTQNYIIRDANNAVIRSEGFDMNSNANYVLAADIDFEGCTVKPMKELSGIFDGNGHIISNIFIDNSNSESDFVPIEFAESTDRVKHPSALFEKLNDGAIVKQLYIENIRVKGDRTVAVIGGECTGTVLVQNCAISNVDLEVYESSAIGGILAFAYNDGNDVIMVENCSINDIEIVEQKNLGNTYTNSELKGNGWRNSAGIVSISKSNLEIVNCTIENSITELKELAAGIVYMQKGKSLYVENCVIEDTNLRASTESAGIVAMVKNANIEITDCRCENVIIQDDSTRGIRGGIVALCVNSTETVGITDCIVRNVDFMNGCDTGGIVGILRGTTETIINDCTVENCDIACYTCLRGGIIAQCETPISMNRNTVDGITMTDGGCNVGGLIGILRYNSSVKSIFNNCSVNDITIEVGQLAAGLVGQVNVPVDFINCHASNLNITTDCGNAGIVAKLSYSTDEDVESTFIDCSVSDSVFTNNADMGGIISLCEEKVKIERCEVSNNELNTVSDSGGIIGILRNSAEIIDCNVKYTEINNHASVGGIVGNLQLLSEQYFNIRGCSVSNIDFDIVYNFGGLIGIAALQHSANMSIINCEVDTVINNDEVNKNESLGGLIGFLHSYNIINREAHVPNEYVIDECSVSNIISSNYARAGGLIGMVAGSQVLIVNCDVSNFAVDVVDYCLGGIVGENIYSELDISDCNVTAVEFNNALHHAGGIIGMIKNGTNAYNTNIDSCNVTGLNINSEKCSGGILGLEYANEVSNLTISDCILDDITIDAVECIGGIAGLIHNNVSTISGCTITNLNLIDGAINKEDIVGISEAVTLNNTNNTVN